MKRVVQKTTLFLILLSFCFNLIGCGVSINTDNPDTSIESGEVVDIVESDPNNAIEELNEERKEELNDEQLDISNDVPKIVFEETSETVYATANVNIRTFYTTEEDNIISVLKKGNMAERIGIHDEWSKVLIQNEVCYIKSDYLTLKKPIVEEIVDKSPDITREESVGAPSSDEIFIANLSIASEIDQLVCVIGNSGSDCTVSFHIKDKDGKWIQQFSIDGDIGSKGITYDKKEGDKKTPAGLYSFTLAFGIKPDPGSLLSFRQITKYDYWIYDINSPDYNTWITSKKEPENNDFEHLIDHNPSYNYALNIDYNSDCVPGLGSAIFLHGYNGSGSTTGCIAIEEEYMKTLIQEVDSSTKILIIPNRDELANY